MSRIYDAIKQAIESRSKSNLPSGRSLGPIDLTGWKPERHWEPGTHIVVYGHAIGECPFYAEVISYSVNSDDGALLLCGPVRDGQDLLLINNLTSQEQFCHVVQTRAKDEQTVEVTVIFPSPKTDFWTNSGATPAPEEENWGQGTP